MKTFYLVIMAVIVAGITIGLFVMMAGIFASNTSYSRDSTGYIEIVPQGFAKAYTTGQKINFSVLIQGFGKYPCLPPEIKIFNDNENEKPVFYYVSQSVSCPSSDEHYMYYFPSQNSTFSTAINQTGNYTLDISLGKDSYQKEFSVTSPTNISALQVAKNVGSSTPTTPADSIRDQNQKLIDSAKSLQATKKFLAKYPNSQADIWYYGGKGEQLIVFSPPRTLFNDTSSRFPLESRTIELQIPVSISNYTAFQNDAKLRCVVISSDDKTGLDYLLYPTNDSSSTLVETIENNNCFDPSVVPVTPSSILGDVSQIYATVEQGNTTILQFAIPSGGSYSSEGVQLPGAVLGGIKAWVFPQQIWGTLSTPITLAINADAYTAPGNYTIPITGTSGWVTNQATGTKTLFDDAVLAQVHLTVIPHNVPFDMKVEGMQFNYATICIKDTCGSGPTNAYGTILISSKNRTDVRLGVSAPGQGWAKIIPDKIAALSGKESARLVTAGLYPYESPSIGTAEPLIITASSNGKNETAVLGAQVTGRVTALHVTGPIYIDNQTINSGGGFLSTLGIVVYDPENNTGSMPVKIAVLGMIDGNSTVPLPPWISEVIPNPSFTLDADQPYYIPAEISKDGGPKNGTLQLLIGEDVGGRHYVMSQNIKIINMWL